jgi:hypothetical protein
MIAYIHANRDRFGVEPICQVLPIALTSSVAWQTASSTRREQAVWRADPGVQVVSTRCRPHDWMP